MAGVFKSWPDNSRGSGKGRLGCAYHDHGPPMTLSGHVRVKVGGGQVLGLGLARAPFHKEAIAPPTEEAQHLHPVGISDARPVVSRRTRAICAAAGKQTASGVVGAVQRMRTSSRLRLRSWVQARVFVDS